METVFDPTAYILIDHVKTLILFKFRKLETQTNIRLQFSSASWTVSTFNVRNLRQSGSYSCTGDRKILRHSSGQNRLTGPCAGFSALILRRASVRTETVLVLWPLPRQSHFDTPPGWHGPTSRWGPGSEEECPVPRLWSGRHRGGDGGFLGCTGDSEEQRYRVFRSDVVQTHWSPFGTWGRCRGRGTSRVVVRVGDKLGVFWFFPLRWAGSHRVDRDVFV